MCLFFSVLFLGPRFGLIVYWLGWPARWELAFDGWVAPFLGLLLAPWFTLTWVICAPAGITGFDYVLLALAGALDLSSLLGGGRSYTGRNTPTPVY